MIIKLNYFQASGKWYSEGDLLVPDECAHHEVIELIRLKLSKGTLPHLVPGARYDVHFVWNDVPHIVHHFPVVSKNLHDAMMVIRHER
jgi:hypothetical protein